MALRYQDYVAKRRERQAQRGIRSEITQSQQANTVRRQESANTVSDEFEVPVRFKDKSKEDVIKSYVELEKLNSQQAQVVGHYRKIMDEHLSQNTQAAAPKQEPVVVTHDDIYNDPNAAIDKKLAASPLSAELTEIKKTLAQQQLEARFNRFQSKHPDFAKVTADPAFQTWVGESDYRQRLFADGNEFDFDAADTLIALYKDVQKTKVAAGASQRRRDARDMTLESVGTDSLPEGQKFSRKAMIDLRVRALKGDEKADAEYQAALPAYRKALQKRQVVD